MKVEINSQRKQTLHLNRFNTDPNTYVETPQIGKTYIVSVEGFMKVFGNHEYPRVIFTDTDGIQEPFLASFIVGRSLWNNDKFPGLNAIDGKIIKVTDAIIFDRYIMPHVTASFAKYKFEY